MIALRKMGGNILLARYYSGCFEYGELNPNNGKFWLVGVDVFVIKHDAYMRIIRVLSVTD